MIELFFFPSPNGQKALIALEELGLLAAKNTGFVDDPVKDNIVLAQATAPGEWVEAGTTIALTVGIYEDGE